MKGLPVVALAPVQVDVQLAYDYFAQRLSGAGDAFLERYFATTDRIRQYPEMFPVKFDDYRRALVPKCAFAIYYFLEPNRAVIAALVGARRHPRLIRDFVRHRRLGA